MGKGFNKDIIGALAISIALPLILCFYFAPRWETNDDIGMSMVAHGYGLAATSSPNLVFSNVIWGYLVQSCPQMNGLLGYSAATLVTLVICGMTILIGLRKVGLDWITGSATARCLLARPILFPQFTINAGLLTVGAFV